LRNDLIVFDFDNQNRQLVLLPPQLVGELAAALSQVLQSVSYSDAIAQEYKALDFNTRPGLEFGIMLAAVREGSIKLGFDVTMQLSGEHKISDATSRKIKAAIFHAFVAASIQFGLFESDKTEANTPLPGASSSAVNQSIERLGRVCATAGVDRVTVMVPDEPTCAVNTRASEGIGALGVDAADIQDEAFGDVSANISLTGDKLEVTENGKPKVLYVAEATIHNPYMQIYERAIVLLDWQSKVDPTTLPPHQPYDVKADFQRFSSRSFKRSGSIPRVLRLGVGILVVTGVRASYQ
jgi:hypothetical protein